MTCCRPAFPTAEDAYLQKLALKQGAAGDQQEEQGNEDEQEEGQQGEDDEDDAMDQGEDGTAESLDQLFAGIDDAKLAKMDESDQVSAMLAHLRVCLHQLLESSKSDMTCRARASTLISILS